VEQQELERLIGRPLRLRYGEILSHPRFPQARAVYLERFLAAYDGEPFVVRLLIESGRFLVFHLTAALEAAQDPARPETWATVGRLKEQMALFGMASGRHIDHLIGRLASVGFMELRASPHDRRVRLLSTTEKHRAHHCEWLAAYFAPLAVLFPDHDYRAPLARDPDYLMTHLRGTTTVLPLAAKLMAQMPETILYFHHVGGSVVLAALIEAALRAGDPGAPLPYAHVGDRFGVSRTHVRNLLKTGEAAGMLKLTTRGGPRVEILPPQWSAFDRGTALGLYLADATGLKAMSTFAKTSAPQSGEMPARTLTRR